MSEAEIIRERMRFILGVIAAMLLFGCLGGEPPANQTNQTNESNQTKPPPVTIIVGNQSNQTTTQNKTNETTAPPPPPEKKVDYEYDPDAIAGVFFFDVGSPTVHGSSILIRKGDLDVLFDAGPADKGSEVVDDLVARGVDDIDVLVSTSADPRRYGGLEAVAEHFGVEEFWWSGETYGDQDYAETVKKISEKAETERVVERGFSEELDGINFTVLNPPKVRFDDVNNDAIVTRIVDRNFSMLLLSNAQKGAHQKLVNEQQSLIKARVMEAPYYGTGEGTRDIGIFLITADPEWMIIEGSQDDSAPNGGDRDPFLALMEQYGIQWEETYDNGTVRVTTDGNDYTVLKLGKGQ